MRIEKRNRKKFSSVLIFLAACTLLFVISSCDLFGFNSVFSGNFWVQNFKTRMPYKINASLLAEGEYCKVYAEDGSGIDAAAAEKIADVFDKRIYQNMLDVFGWEEYFNGDLLNTMEYIDSRMGDQDGKLCILLLDIKDDYKSGEHNSYIAGYFNSWDLHNSIGSNRRDMIYIDTYPGFDHMDTVYESIAHEMQHLMNYGTSSFYERQLMDTWIDEGLSSAAEWLYISENGNNENHSLQRVSWYNTNGGGDGAIDLGNNFFVWGNRSGNPYAVLDDYSTVYLFFQWLRLQSGSAKIYNDIIKSQSSDYNAVTQAAGFNGNWPSLIGRWLEGNYSPKSVNGYADDPVLSNIDIHYAPGNATTASLFPGEGVYSYISGEYLLPADTGNINYVMLSKALLTFNANELISGSSETGVITGENAPPKNNIQGLSQARGAAAAPVSVLTGPFPIDAVLR